MSAIAAIRKQLIQVPLVVWTILVLVPFVLSFILGFRDNTGIYEHPLGIGGEYHPENFAAAWRGPVGSAGMGVFFMNSLIAVAIGITIDLTLACLGSYFVTMLPKKFRPWYLLIFIFGTVIPPVLTIIPLFQVLNPLGLTDNVFVLGFLYGVGGLPGAVLVLSAHFADYPKALIEAARLDGLTELGTFWRVVLPTSTGVVAAAAIIAVIGMWGETQLAIALLQDASNQTIPVGILGFRGLYTSQLGPLFAGLSIATIPVFAFYLFFHRYIDKGLSLGGAVK